MFKELLLENKILTEAGGWESYKKELERIVKKYKKYETDSSTTKSAPDTSKFVAVHQGFIQLREKHVVYGGTYGLDRFLPYAVVIGTNVNDKIKTKIIKEVTKVSKKYEDKLTIDNNKVFFIEKYGSAYHTFGLGN